MRKSSITRSIGLGCLPVLFFAVTNSVQAGEKQQEIKSLDDFNSCVTQLYRQESCLIGLEKYIKSTPKDAMAAAKQVRLNFNSSVSLRFFEVAAKRNVPGFCEDRDLQLAVVHGLGLPADYPDAARARALFSGACHQQLASAVTAELQGESSGGYLARNACPILKQNNQTPKNCQPAAAAIEVVQTEERLPTLEKSQIKLGLVKVYKGPEGELVTMAPIEGGDLFLVRFDGIAGPWNGKVLLHKRADRGNDSADFWTQHDGVRWVSMAHRGQLRVFVPGTVSRNGFTVGYAEALSQKADKASLLNGL